MGATRKDFIGLFMAALLASGCAGDAASDAELGADEDGLDTEVQQAEQTAPRPIVMVAGMMEDKNTVAPMVNFLKGKGFDVTVYVPPQMGLGDINNYATAVSSVVDGVLQRTGAEKVDLIGHSQGGVTARRYLQLASRGGSAPVQTLISMGSPQQGTDGGALISFMAAAGFFNAIEGAKQLIAGSAFLYDLNKRNDPTPGDTRYLAIGTKQDMVTKPVARSGIPGAEHVVMQDVCPGRNVGHFGLLSDAWVQQIVLSVLAGGPATGDCAARPLGGPI